MLVRDVCVFFRISKLIFLITAFSCCNSFFLIFAPNQFRGLEFSLSEEDKDDLSKEPTLDDEEGWADVSKDSKEISDSEHDVFVYPVHFYFSYSVHESDNVFELRLKSLFFESTDSFSIQGYSSSPTLERLNSLVGVVFDFVLPQDFDNEGSTSVKLVIATVDTSSKLIICTPDFMHISKTSVDSLPCGMTKIYSGLSDDQKIILRKLANGATKKAYKTFSSSVKKLKRLGAMSVGISADAFIALLLGVSDYAKGVHY